MVKKCKITRDVTEILPEGMGFGRFLKFARGLPEEGMATLGID